MRDGTEPPARPRAQAPWLRGVPNAVTLLSLGLGLTSIQLALAGDLDHAVRALFVMMLLDLLDGRLARLLGTSSPMGAQLDQLADMVGFGCAPILLLWIGMVHGLGPLAWLALLPYALAAAYRLARFVSEPAVASTAYSAGLPVPAAAGFALMPLLAERLGWLPPSAAAWISVALTPLLALLMASRWPCWTSKGLRLAGPRLAAAILGASLVLAAALAYPHIVGLTLAALYGVAALALGWRRRSGDGRRT